MTIVVVTHEMASAALIADRMAVMHKGQVIAVGTPAEIRANPHPRVQQFLKRIPDQETGDVQAYMQTLTQPPS
jgi:ABC-type transporter Mla maintaining outer membrane lipid asymmetry ATPase subunit MlaF